MSEIGAAVALAIWLYLLLGRGAFWRMRVTLPEGVQLPFIHPRVAVVIPARNEASLIGQTLPTVCRQDYPGAFRIFLVDDHSDDSTSFAATGAAEAAGQSHLLTICRAEGLPDGWTGKVWAMSEGVRRAGSFEADYILFTDADIVHPPDTLSRLVAHAVASHADLVSVMAKLPARTFAEKLAMPAFVFFFFKLYPPALVASPSRTAAAAGGCLLVRKSTLERAGGLAGIRSEIIDDCALARAIKECGGRLWLGLAPQLESIRRYPTLDDAGRMISRTAFHQLNYSLPLLLATVVGMFATYILPFALLIPGSPLAAVMAAAAIALMLGAYAPVLRFYRLNWVWGLLLPFTAMFYTGATVHSAVAHWSGKSSSWRGRLLSVGRK